LSAARRSHGRSRKAQQVQAPQFAPFRLLILDRYEAVDCWPDGERIRHRRSYLRSAILRTSSGLGDAKS
jgi:hypothetical protein